VSETGGAGPTDTSDAAFTIGPQIALFADDFEDGDYAGWTDGAGVYTREVTNLTAADGSTFSLSLTGGSSSHQDGVSHSFADLTPTEVSFWVRSSDAAAANAYFVFGTPAASAVFFMMDDAGVLYVANAMSAPAYVADQWYHVSFTMNWVGKTFDFYLDGGLVEANIPFFDVAADRLSILHLYNYHNSQAWWDEIEFLP
jgi:hypothetical protein